MEFESKDVLELLAQKIANLEVENAMLKAALMKLEKDANEKRTD